MKRDYETWVTDEVQFFVGKEVEATVFRWLQTLFVDYTLYESGVQIYAKAKSAWVSHVYIGANHTFDLEKFRKSQISLAEFPDMNFTFEIPVEYRNEIVDSAPANFCFILSVRIPYIDNLPSNTFIKFDDIDFKATNSGVYVARVRHLLEESDFNDWSVYTADKLI